MMLLFYNCFIVEIVLCRFNGRSGNDNQHLFRIQQIQYGALSVVKSWPSTAEISEEANLSSKLPLQGLNDVAPKCGTLLKNLHSTI